MEDTNLVLFLRPNDFDRPERRDYEVRHDGKVVGRIYSGAGSQGDKWLCPHGWGSAQADDLEEAKSKLKAEWNRRNPGPL